MIALETHELGCAYGDRSVFEAISLSIRFGEVLVLLGPNGSGKTTLLRALARMLRPKNGKVLFHEIDIWSQRAASVARQLAMMPQNERRDWPLTVEESVWLGRAPHTGWLFPFRDADQSIVEDALQQTGMSSLRSRPITELSGGEWRRMILARALAQQAKVLLLDEPTAGLDLRYQVEVLRLVRQLTLEKQLAIVMTMHDLNLAAMFGQRAALLANRRLAACGTPEQVFTAELIGRTFGIPVSVIQHPIYKTPFVVPLPDDPLDSGGK